MTSGIRYTEEQVIDMIENFGCKLESSYLGARKDVTIICVCGRRFTTKFYRFIDKNNTHRCSTCAKKIAAKKLRSDFDELVRNCESIGYFYIEGEYTTRNSQLIFEDSEGYKYRVSYASIYHILQGKVKRLEMFSYNNPFTFENMKNWLKINKNDFEILGGHYTTRNSTLISYCKICYNEFNSSWINLKSRKFCPECEIMAMSDRFRFSVDKVNEILKNAGYYLVNGNYEGWDSKMNLVDDFGYEYFSSINCIIKGRLSTFGKGNPYTVSNICKWIEINEKNYKYVKGKYINARKRNLIFNCNKCKNDWKTCWNAIETGNSCPRCGNYSKGETRIEKFLLNNNISYEREYWFPDCRRLIRKPLEFDFAIFDKNKKIMMICEYDGESHFMPVDYAGRGEEWAKEQLELSKVKDEIKNKYCKNKGYSLLRIPYWDFDNIEKILEEALKPIPCLNFQGKEV